MRAIILPEFHNLLIGAMFVVVEKRSDGALRTTGKIWIKRTVESAIGIQHGGNEAASEFPAETMVVEVKP